MILVEALPDARDDFGVIDGVIDGIGLRRAVTGELKRRGIDYLLVFDTDNGADDLRLNSDLWGMRAVGDYKGARLYQLP